MKSAGPSTRMDSTDRRTRFEHVYAANYQPILAYALRRTQTPDDAADVVAETFLTARCPATQSRLGHRRRSRHRGIPSQQAGDECYGRDPKLRAGLQERGIGYVLAVARNHYTQIATRLRARVDRCYWT